MKTRALLWQSDHHLMSNLKSRKCIGKYVESPYSSWYYLYLTSSEKHQDTSKSIGRNAFLPLHVTGFTCSMYASVVRNALRWTEDTSEEVFPCTPWQNNLLHLTIWEAWIEIKMIIWSQHKEVRKSFIIFLTLTMKYGPFPSLKLFKKISRSKYWEFFKQATQGGL